jgi:small subunit ribosomal protein S7
MEEIKLFNKYPSSGISVGDPGLRDYVSLKPVMVPRSFGRHAEKKFQKSKVNIIERLVNKLYSPGHKGKKHWRTSEFCTGKSATATKIVRKTLEILERQTKKNPIETIAKAVENASPREEVTVIEMAGIRVPKQVDTSPQRRVDLALRWLIQGTFQATVNKKTPFEEGLAAEIIAASNNDPKSFAVSKKVETERQAAASK